jgi:hypothetical protein
MKTIKNIIAALTCSLLISSCGINSALILNHNQNSTQVLLSSNNYKVTDKVAAALM